MKYVYPYSSLMAVCRGVKRKQSAEEAPAKPKYVCKPIIQLQPPSDAQEEPVRLELTERSSQHSSSPAPSAAQSPSPPSPTADRPHCDTDNCDESANPTNPRNDRRDEKEPRNELDAEVLLVCAARGGDGAAGDCACANKRADVLKTSDEVRVSRILSCTACCHLRLYLISTSTRNGATRHTLKYELLNFLLKSVEV